MSENTPAKSLAAFGAPKPNRDLDAMIASVDGTSQIRPEERVGVEVPVQVTLSVAAAEEVAPRQAPLMLSEDEIDELLSASADPTTLDEMDDHSAAQLVRSIRRRESEIERLEAYEKYLKTHIDKKVGEPRRQLKSEVEEKRALLEAFIKARAGRLEAAGKKVTPLSFPDLGSASLSTRTSYEYDEEKLRAFFDSEDGQQFRDRVLKPQPDALDKSALKELAKEVVVAVPEGAEPEEGKLREIPGFSEVVNKSLQLKLK